jgi:hypothetical protein
MKGTDSLIVYILGWTAVAITTAVCLGLFFGIVTRVARWVAG